MSSTVSVEISSEDPNEPADSVSRSTLRFHSARNRVEEAAKVDAREKASAASAARATTRRLPKPANRFDSRRDDDSRRPRGGIEPPADRLPLRSRDGMQDVAAHIYPRRDLAGFSRQIPANVLPAKAEMKKELVSRRASNSFRRARAKLHRRDSAPRSFSSLPPRPSAGLATPRFNPASSTARN